MKRLAVLCILACSLIMPSVTAARVRRSYDSHRIKVRPGHTFSISLKSNPSTGYMWQIQNPIDKTLLIIVNKTFAPQKRKLAGSPGKEVWRFKALKKGTIFIEFAYKRSWEKEIVKRTTYSIVIR